MKLNSRKMLLSAVACMLCLSIGAQTVEGSEVTTAWKDVPVSSFKFTTSVTLGDWFVTLDKTCNVARVDQYQGSSSEVIVPDTFTYNEVKYITVGLGGSNYYVWYNNYNNDKWLVKSVTLPHTLRFLGHDAFLYCMGLTQITIPSLVESIGNYAFRYCASLEKVSLPASVSSIGGHAFSDCTGLNEVVLSDSLKTIGDYAFNRCGALESMTIPASVTGIGYDPFSNCSKLKTLRCDASVPPTCTNNFNENICVVYVPDGCGTLYEAATYWKNRIIVDGEGVMVNVEGVTPGSLGDRLLEQVEYLRQVNYLTVSGILNSDDIYNIQNRMTGLLTIDMSGVEMAELPDKMFYQRYALQQVILPAGLTSIGHYAFFDCVNLQDVILPTTLKYIGEYAFEDCDRFENVIIPEGVVSVGANAYQYCSALQTVKWPSTATEISGATFYQSSVERVILPEGLSSIGRVAFYQSAIKELQCPSTLKSIDAGAFSGCYQLSSAIFNEGLNSLACEAFYNCDALTGIVLPSTLHYCDTPFENCDSIKEVTCLSLFPPILEDDYSILYNVNKENCTLYVPEWTINNYKLAVGWEVFPTIKPIHSCWPGSIVVGKEVSLNIPDTMPAEYNPNVSLLYDNNYGYGSLTLNGDATLSVGTYYMEHSHSYQDYDYQGYRYDYSSLLVNTNMRADNVVIEFFTKNDQWRFFSFPFDVKISDILPIYENTNFVIRKYSGKDRAELNFSNTWQDMTIDSVLHAGEGYILQSSRYDSDGYKADWSGFYFNAINNANKNHIFAKDNRTVILDEYQSEFSHNRSWNLIGNPYPCFYDTRAMDFTAPITVWDSFNSTYYAYSPVDDEYILSPTEAFFVQRPVDAESITFAADGRQTDRVVRDRATKAKAYTHSADIRRVFDLVLSDEGMSDRTRFVINPVAACGYEMNRDASKFMSSDVRAAQLYSIEGDVNFAINERPIGNGVVALGAYFGRKDTYSLTLDTKVEGVNVFLVDKVVGTETNLLKGGYTFIAEAGVAENRFEVRVETSDANDDVTSMANLSGKVSVEVADGRILVSAPCESSIVVCNAAGQRVATAIAVSATFELGQGVYVVKVQDTVHKVSVGR